MDLRQQARGFFERDLESPSGKPIKAAHAATQKGLFKVFSQNNQPASNYTKCMRASLGLLLHNLNPDTAQSSAALSLLSLCLCEASNRQPAASQLSLSP